MSEAMADRFESRLEMADVSVRTPSTINVSKAAPVADKITMYSSYQAAEASDKSAFTRAI